MTDHHRENDVTGEARLLVCGGRLFGVLPSKFESLPSHRQIEEVKRVGRERALLVRSLDKVREHLRSKHGLDVVAIAQGGAPGADTLAREWAEGRAIECFTYMADWKREGPAAGPRRNQRMLNEFKPTHVVAFPGGRGTADMVRRAKAAGVPVWEVA